jgi:bifunctional non-homologous end joining protein LigD
MLATATKAAADLPGDPSQWQVEPKLDGLRCIVVRNGAEVSLWSRNHLPWTARWPSVVEAVRSLPADSFVLDGELVRYDAAGNASFGLLQSGQGGPPVLVVFDLLQLLGRTTTELELEERRRLLGMALQPAPTAVLRLIDVLDGSPADLLTRACAAGWEGVVAKRRGSAYTAGRSPAWRKLKCSASQELVVGGWTLPSGSRVGLGALLVGHYQGDDLVYAGKVGTGFSDRVLRELTASLTALATPVCPFTPAPGVRGAHWARPALVAAVSFTEWTSEGRLRHPSFQGLRTDKDPRSVVRELPSRNC